MMPVECLDYYKGDSVKRFDREGVALGELIYACIAPHGGEIIPELAGKNEARMAETRRSMALLGERLRAKTPDALIVVTPHGTRIDGQIAIVNSETVVGSVEENGRTYTMVREVERALARAIAEEAGRAGIPCGLLNFGTSDGPLSRLPLDWGAIVPLAFMPDVPVVIITPSRLVQANALMAFGRALRAAVDHSGVRAGLIASCDWSHTHAASGPYGYHPAAKTVDEKVVGSIKEGRLEALKEISEEEIDNAKPDGISQALVLAGAVPPAERKVEWLSYEAPTYFGLICAEIKA